MNILRKTLRLSLVCAGLLLFAGDARAQGVVRFVASFGSDANPCTRPAPCRSMQRGVDATPDGAELHVMDAGEYGPNVNITKSITISAEGVSATLSTPSGNSFFVNAPGKTVVLRKLLMRGLGTGERGVLVDAVGSLHIEGCEIEHFSRAGILFQPAAKLSIQDTVLRSCGRSGLDVFVNSGTARVTVENGRFLNNAGSGIIFQGAGVTEATVTNSLASGNSEHGFLVGSADRVNISHSVATYNSGDGFRADGAGAQLTATYSLARGNTAAGFSVSLSNTLRVSDSVSTDNQYGFFNSSGTLQSRSANNNGAAPGTNMVAGNTTNVSGTVTYYNGN